MKYVGPEKRPVVVLGKTKVSPSEIHALETMGYLLKLWERPLHTTNAEGTAAAVARGYAKAGGQVHMHSANLGDIDGDTLAVVDEELGRRLTAKLPDWADRGWTTIDSKEELIDYISAAVTWTALHGLPIV